MTWNNLTDDGLIKSKFIDINQEMINGLISEIDSQGKNKDNSTYTGLMTPFMTKSPYFKEFHTFLEKYFDCELKAFCGHRLTGLEHIGPHRHKPYSGGNVDSFCYYLDVPEGSGQIYFSDYDLEIVPENKMFLSFHVDLMHEVLPNEFFDIKRYAIAGRMQRKLK